MCLPTMVSATGIQQLVEQQELEGRGQKSEKAFNFWVSIVLQGLRELFTSINSFNSHNNCIR